MRSFLMVSLFFGLFALPGLSRAELASMEFKSTEEAYKGVGRIAFELRQKGDRRALFAGIYALTIEATHRKLARGEFKNTRWVQALIVNYANLYRRTLQLELSGHRSELPRGWRLAFGYIASTSARPGQGKEVWSADLDAVYGIHVHIARDLVEALWITPTRFTTPSIKADFLKITESLRSTMPAIYRYYLRFRGHASVFAPIEQSVMMNWIAQLRARAWEDASFYQDLSKAQKAGALRKIDFHAEALARRHGVLLPLLPR